MIIGYFGLPGSGKTYKMAVDGLALMKKGYNVYSNFPLEGAYKLDYDVLITIPRFRRPAVLLLDEVQRYANSRDWASMPDELYFIFSQGRKLGLDLFYSAQDSSRVDKTLREVTNYFYDIKFYMFGRDIKPNVRYSKFKFFFYSMRVLTVYSKNSDYSMQVRPMSNKRFLLHRKPFSSFDTAYMISRRSFDLVPFEFKKWVL